VEEQAAGPRAAVGAPPPAGRNLRRWLPDLLGISWVLASGLAMLVPALVHGRYLGPIDLLYESGLSKQPWAVASHGDNADQLTNSIAWANLVWTQVHDGHLPLWNPFSGLGTPLAFNWQSAPFSLQAMVGYLVPLRYAYTVGVLVEVIVAGTGVYVLGRVLRLGVLACVFSATVFELSGPLAGWLGWPHGAVLAWAGWLFGSALLVVRGRHRARDITFLAVVVALALYAGQPEIVIMIVLALAVFVVALLAQQAVKLGSAKRILRPAFDLLVAMVAGGALAAPLALPGLQISTKAVHGLSGLNSAQPLRNLTHVISRGFNGVGTPGNPLFGESLTYRQTMAHVGLIAVVLAVVAVAVRWRRRPEVVALAAVAVVMAAIVFVPPVVSFMQSLPLVGRVLWQRALLPMTFAIAVLAGFGMDAMVRSSAERAVRRWTAAGFAVAGLVVLALYVGGRGTLTPFQAGLRTRSLIWPAVDTAVGLAVVGAMFASRRRRRPDQEAHRNDQARRFRLGPGRWAGLALLACETAFLVAAGAPLWSSSPRPVTPTPAEMTLRRAVGSSLVGFGPGPGACSDLGIMPNVNVLHDVHELSVYDPAIPNSYFQAWADAGGRMASPYLAAYNLFCPWVTSATHARRFGVAFVLEHAGAPGPKGGVFVMKVGDEDLYRIPGAGEATMSPLLSTGALPAPDAAGTTVPVSHPDPTTWKLATAQTTPQVLRLRLTDVPGWHATIDGRPLALEPFAGIMLQARIPPGRHSVELRYWPTQFTAGIVLAACSALGLSIALTVGGLRSRRRARLAAPGTP